MKHQTHPIQVEVILVPGAKISTTDPKLEKFDRVSVISVAPTVITAGARAGEWLRASSLSFPCWHIIFVRNIISFNPNKQRRRRRRRTYRSHDNMHARFDRVGNSQVHGRVGSTSEAEVHDRAALGRLCSSNRPFDSRNHIRRRTTASIAQN